MEANIKPESSQNNIKIANCIAVISKDGKLLLTKRAEKMRSFPNAWVLPGGHLDPGESLQDGAIREIFEETGIKLSDSDNIKPLFMYESAGGRVQGTTVI
jgi:8-oxo-dGTP pyrophosphatase MutT (NUDIX family)